MGTVVRRRPAQSLEIARHGSASHLARRQLFPLHGEECSSGPESCVVGTLISGLVLTFHIPQLRPGVSEFHSSIGVLLCENFVKHAVREECHLQARVRHQTSLTDAQDKTKL